MNATVALPAPAVVRTGAVPVVVLAGALVGATYGIALRGWMRLITTDPEFTVSGTGFIVGAFVVLGAMAGLAAAGRARGWRASLLVVRVVGIILSMGCFVAAGALMFPTIVPAALGVARSDWPRPLRAACIALGGVAAVVVVLVQPELTPVRRLLALAIYLALCVVEVRLVAELYAPSVAPGRVGSGARILPIVVGVAALGLLVIGTIGL